VSAAFFPAAFSSRVLAAFFAAAFRSAITPPRLETLSLSSLEHWLICIHELISSSLRVAVIRFVISVGIIFVAICIVFLFIVFLVIWFLSQEHTDSFRVIQRLLGRSFLEVSS
jgi:hypothetical protein